MFFEDDDSQNVKAGQGMAISMGGYFRPIASSPSKSRPAWATSSRPRRRRMPTSAWNAPCCSSGVSHRWPNGFYLGGGLVQHMSPTVDGDGFFEDIDFDDATGFNLEVGWRWIALHYTDMTYESDLYEDVDASHFGVRFTYRFGQPGPASLQFGRGPVDSRHTMR